MSYKGYFKPQNYHKYRGDSSNIFYRSLWERKFMVYLDKNPKVLYWSSEEIIIPYISPKDNRKHKYYPDFLVTVKNKKGIHTYLCEIKPSNQCKPPKRKNSKRFLTEQRTYLINQAKWNAAKRVCKQKGWGWKVITEKELNI
tara:strand:- start:566 stop:991 length:426 start_codon:yes stop_codon:yes gene_type:complete